jgi:hypothetical protein
MLNSCFKYTKYNGDGKFVDNGFMVYSKRYVINLGDIDLSKADKYSYSLTRLPRASFVIGISITENQQNSFNAKRPYYPNIIKIELTDSQGNILVNENSALKNWTRSFTSSDSISYLYQTTITIDHAKKDPLVSPQGTYFNTDSNKDTLTLHLEVLKSDIYYDRSAELIIHGWGREQSITN